MMKKNYITPQINCIDLQHELPVMEVGGSINKGHDDLGDTDLDDSNGRTDAPIKHKAWTETVWEEEW